MPIWKQPPVIKIYEALGCLADKRIEITGSSAKVYSSSRGKYYTVTYDQGSQSIMCNDNGSYWQGYLGYPAIAYLLSIGTIPYALDIPTLLKDIKWKDLNTKFKNDWGSTEKYCQDLVIERGGNLSAFLHEIDSISNWLSTHTLSVLGPKTKPPSGY